MIKAVDEVTFQKLDNAAVVDFLTSSASAFFENQKIGQKEVDNFRLVLSGIGSSPSREEPILIALEQQKTEFLTILEIRCAIPRLVQNIFSYCLRPRLIELQASLAHFGAQLLKKSELYFNRSFKIYSAGRYLDDQLAPQFIVSYCQALKITTETLSELIGSFSCFRGNSMGPSLEEDQLLEKAMALGLGFNRVQHDFFESHFHPIGADLKDLEKILSCFLDQIAFFQTQLTYNGLCLNDSLAKVLRHDLMVEMEKLRAVGFYSEKASFEDGNLVVQDVYRRQFLRSFDSFHMGLNLWLEFILTSMRGTPSESKSTLGFSEASYRQMTCALLECGTAPNVAQEALDALVEYQAKHQISADEIFSGELARIHPTLKSVSHLLTKILINQLQGTPELSAKSKAIAHSKELLSFFQKTLSQTLLIAAFGLMPVLWSGLSGCGLKSNPNSEVPALRPDIPFKAKPRPRFRGLLEKSTLLPEKPLLGIPNSDKALKDPPIDTQKP